MEIIARTEYTERPAFASDLSFIGDKGVTKQSDSQDCDINSIFKKYEKTGQLPDLIVKDGRYGDFSSVADYQEAQNIIIHAQQQWENLDEPIRRRFANNPKEFLAFVENPANIDEVEKMGLLKPEFVKARQDARDLANAEKIAAIEAARKAQLPT
ncbi:MAG: internal scaffolding protein [Arizlama microvirus]|nr:MAG: internal scaffolding protein [Arizlama microvirus]